MNIRRTAALDCSNLLNDSNHNSKSAPALNFQKILNTAAQKASKTDTFVNAEQSLKEIYPDLKYHVLDTSQFKYWNRLDFPTSKFYEDTIDENTINELKFWSPKTQTATGYEPLVQRDLEKIQKGLHVVMIHPAVQEKMDQDPAYAKQIVSKVQKYFDNDIRMNAAIDPESVKSMSQSVSITKDGEIGFHHTVCDGPSKQQSNSEEVGLKKGKKQSNLLNSQRPLEPASTSPLLEQAAAAPFEYDYNHLYGVSGFIFKRKTPTIYE